MSFQSISEIQNLSLPFSERKPQETTRAIASSDPPRASYIYEVMGKP